MHKKKARGKNPASKEKTSRLTADTQHPTTQRTEHAKPPPAPTGQATRPTASHETAPTETATQTKQERTNPTDNQHAATTTAPRPNEHQQATPRTEKNQPNQNPTHSQAPSKHGQNSTPPTGTNPPRNNEEAPQANATTRQSNNATRTNEQTQRTPPKRKQNKTRNPPTPERTARALQPFRTKARTAVRPRFSSASSHTNSSFRRKSGCGGELCIILASCVTMVAPCVHYYLHVVEQAHGRAGVSGSTETTAKRMDACSVAARPPCRRRGVICQSAVLLFPFQKSRLTLTTKKDGHFSQCRLSSDVRNSRNNSFLLAAVFVRLVFVAFSLLVSSLLALTL